MRVSGAAVEWTMSTFNSSDRSSSSVGHQFPAPIHISSSSSSSDHASRCTDRQRNTSMMSSNDTAGIACAALLMVSSMQRRGFRRISRQSDERRFERRISVVGTTDDRAGQRSTVRCDDTCRSYSELTQLPAVKSWWNVHARATNRCYFCHDQRGVATTVYCNEREMMSGWVTDGICYYKNENTTFACALKLLSMTLSIAAHKNVKPVGYNKTDKVGYLSLFVCYEIYKYYSKIQTSRHI